ncbi:MAG TPA: hypothetical protein DEQ38_03875 [Elusimicrobia bacterium]|nr:MAG: hypothetical protein A2089_13055 [Elusimicrobia bacterium GWD2_63_28]HCC47243.1 hypothetical protein [Elusimicrobiota bacterium]
MPIIIVLVALAAAGWLGFMAAAGGQYYILVGGSVLLVALLAFFRPKLSLALLVFSMLLSPELTMGTLTAQRELVIRYDDILLIIIFLSWFARTAIQKDRPFITSTPAQMPVLLYTALFVISTAFGVMRGDISWAYSTLYVLKYIEYFLLFFMAANIVESEEDVKYFLRLGLIVAVLVTIYAYFYYYSAGIGTRATAPFEAAIGRPEEGEPASLGGYYLLVFGVFMAMLVEGGGLGLWRVLLLLAFMFPAFLITFSRASYIGFIFMVPALFLLTQKRRILLAGIFAAGLLAVSLMPVLKQKVMDRITMTYRGAYATENIRTGLGGTVRLELSAAERVYSLKRVIFEKLPKHPLIGWGVTGVGLGDTQYSLILGEVGLLGAALFCWMLYRLLFTAKVVWKSYQDPYIRALALGFIIATVGLLFQSLGVNSFIIVRIMEPYWFMAAMLGALYLKRRKTEEAAS